MKLNRKVTIFGKQISVIAIALLAMAGLASAGVLSYYGMITGTATVSQSVKVDGQNWNIDIMEAFTGDLVAGNTLYGAMHYISNDASVPAIVKLETTKSGPWLDTIAEGVTYTYEFKINTTGTVSNWDRVVTVPSPSITKVSDITSWKFKYMLLTGVSESPYIVLELDTDGNGIKDEWLVSWQEYGVSTGTWYTYTKNEWHTVVCSNHRPGESQGHDPLAETITECGYTNAKVLAIKVAVGEWASVVPTTEKVKDILINGLSAIENGIIIPAKSSTTPEGNVEFDLEYAFNITAYPGTYTITTGIKPA